MAHLPAVRAADWIAFDLPLLSPRTAGGRSGSRDRADRSALPLPGDLLPTSAACAVPHHPVRTTTLHHATSTRCAAPSSMPADAAYRAERVPPAVRRPRE